MKCAPFLSSMALTIYISMHLARCSGDKIKPEEQDCRFGDGHEKRCSQSANSLATMPALNASDMNGIHKSTIQHPLLGLKTERACSSWLRLLPAQLALPQGALASASLPRVQEQHSFLRFQSIGGAFNEATVRARLVKQMVQQMPK